MRTSRLSARRRSHERDSMTLKASCPSGGSSLFASPYLASYAQLWSVKPG